MDKEYLEQIEENEGKEAVEAFLSYAEEWDEIIANEIEL